MKLDSDIQKMTPGEVRQALMRMRKLLRTHRDRADDERCWHADDELYARALPEQKPAGKMTKAKIELLCNCERYIDRQQCIHTGGHPAVTRRSK